MDALWEILFGTLLLNPIWSWAMPVSTALLVLFAMLAARQLSWSWAVAELSLIVALVPRLFAGPGLSVVELFPLTFVTLLVPVLGWWNWRRSIVNPESTGIRVQRAGLRIYLIAAAILLAAGLVAWVPLIVDGVLHLASALSGLGRTTTVDELQGLGTPLIMVILHAAVVAFAVRGYRSWRTALTSIPRAPAPHSGLL